MIKQFYPFLLNSLSNMPTPQPFKIAVSDADLQLLKSKLSNIRLPATNPDGWTEQQGVPADRMTYMLSHWLNSYLPRWREREATMNKFPMYTIPVDAGEFGELQIHFVWTKATRPNAIPLLFLHGWPGCFLEGKKIWNRLVEGENDEAVFDVVVPSLPNFGFSDGVGKVYLKYPESFGLKYSNIDQKEFHIGHYATVMHKLMIALGYEQYVIQGGDWGSIISRQQARMYPEAVRAVHVNLVALRWSNFLRAPLLFLKFLILPWTAAEKKGLGKGRRYIVDGNGYYRIQATRPLTMAYLLSDSPAGLLGYVWEKLRLWSENADEAFTDDEVLDWMSVYWFSKAGPGASVTIYHEGEAGLSEVGGSYWEWQPAPMGVTQFPGDVVGMPSAVLRLLGTVVFERWAEKGGHFAAWEAPDELIQDLRTMFGKGGGAYSVVEGKTGYGEEKKDI
jgi:pimeloyl-ACP methyl ester carboxylesterase